MQEPRVIQGLNFVSQTSVVIIETKETEDVKKLLELIGDFHPIFIEKYYFAENSLYIETLIPFLWREIGEYIQKLNNAEMSYEECKTYIVEVIIKNRIKSMSTIPTLHSTILHGYEVTPTIISEKVIATNEVGYTKTFNRRYTLGCGKGSEVIMSISSSRDSIVGERIQRDKYITNTLITKLGLQIPKYSIISKKSEIDKIWDEFEKPVVIKPVGLTGGAGVVMEIKTKEEAKKAFEYATKKIDGKDRKDWQQKIMIQEQVSGEDYRLLVIDGKLEIATKRIPAFIVGDGQSTIQQIIELTNKDPKRDTTNPTHTLKPIKIDEPLTEYLKEQKLTLQDIPEEGEKVPLRKVASMSQGGITEDFTDSVSPEIKYIVESIAQSIHAFTLGVDILCKDLSKPLTQDNGAILEVNTMPEAYLNFFPVIGTDRSNVVDIFVKKLLKQNKTKRIVVVGTMLEDIPTLLRKSAILKAYISKDEIVGEYKEGEIRINGLNINKDLEKWRAVEALKINASLDTIIIHNRDWQEVKETGLGFNKIDMIIVSKELSNTEEMKTIKKYQRKKLIDKVKII